MSTVTVSPGRFEMTSLETLPLKFDTTPLLVGGETPSAPASVLTNLATGATFPAGLSGAPSVSGNFVTQTVAGLAAETSYRLSVTFTAAAGKVWTMDLTIVCVY